MNPPPGEGARSDRAPGVAPGREAEPRWRRFLFRSEDVSSLVALRIAFGLLMFWEVWRFFDHRYIYYYWIQPEFHFRYYGFEWVHPLPGDGMYVLWVVMGLLAIGIATGFFYRLSATLFFLGYTYSFLLEQSRYQNHYYLICLVSFLMILVPANAAFSLDVKMGLCRRRHQVPAWPRFLLIAQMTAVYIFGAVAKMNGDWLIRAEPVRMWLHQRRGYPLIGEVLDTEFAAYFVSYSGMIFDLIVAPMLLWRRTRVFAVICLVGFHMSNEILFSIGIFPVLASALTMVFFAPDWPRRFIHPDWFKLPPQSPRGDMPGGAWTLWTQRAVPVFVCAWIAVQVFVPLRHFLYPGNPSWTEEGHRWSWHMKLRDKKNRCIFMVTDTQGKFRKYVKAEDVLPDWQAKKAISRPDMILQLAHHIGETARRKGIDNPKVYARATCSLNGRTYAPIIDPQVDLMGVARNLKTAEWILPLIEEGHNAIAGE